jgi:S-adenosylmethionine hydrolase
VEQLRRFGLSSAHISDGVLTVHVLRSDTFGNLILDAGEEQLLELGVMPGDTLTISHAGAIRTARYAATFAEVTPGELLIYEDATRMVALAVNRGSAAELLGAGADAELTVRPA